MRLLRTARRSESWQSIVWLTVIAYAWIGVWSSFGHVHALRLAPDPQQILALQHGQCHTAASDFCAACVWTQSTTALLDRPDTGTESATVLTETILPHTPQLIPHIVSLSIPRAPPA